MISRLQDVIGQRGRAVRPAGRDDILTAGLSVHPAAAATPTGPLHDPTPGPVRSAEPWPGLGPGVRADVAPAWPDPAPRHGSDTRHRHHGRGCPQARHAGDGRPRPGSLSRRGEPPTGPPGRDPYLDNVKLAAILLVVVGHVLEVWLEPRGARAMYFLIYSFHMPLFVLVAGYLSRRFTASAEQCRRLVAQLLVPYLVFQVLYSVSGDLLVGNPVRISLVTPDYTVWFLLSLATWRLLGVVLVQLRYPLTIAIGISLAVGLSDLIGRPLSLSRTLALLPFFVAGLTLRREHLERLHRPAVRVVAPALLLLAAAGCFWTVPRLSTRYLYWRASYHRMELSWTEGLASRAAALLLAAVLAAAFLAIIPWRALPFTRLGENTMYAYLLHGFLVRPLRHTDIAAWMDTALEQLAVTMLAVLVGVLLLTHPVRRATRWLVEPNVSWLLARENAAARSRALVPQQSQQPPPLAPPPSAASPAPAGFDRLLTGVGPGSDRQIP